MVCQSRNLSFCCSCSTLLNILAISPVILTLLLVGTTRYGACIIFVCSSGDKQVSMYLNASSVYGEFFTMCIVLLYPTAHSFGSTKSTGTSRALSSMISLKIAGAMSIWPCWNKAAAWLGLAATAPIVGLSSASRFNGLLILVFTDT